MDTDGDGYINVREIKEHIRNQQCRNLPPQLAKHILQMNDDDSNGVLDFDEFYQMSIRQEWLFQRLIKKYCRLIVPPPRRLDEDETGKFRVLFHLSSIQIDQA